MTEECRTTWREALEAGDAAGAMAHLLESGRITDAQRARVALLSGDDVGALELVKLGRMQDGDRAEILAALQLKGSQFGGELGEESSPANGAQDDAHGNARGEDAGNAPGEGDGRTGEGV